MLWNMVSPNLWGSGFGSLVFRLVIRPIWGCCTYVLLDIKLASWWKFLDYKLSILGGSNVMENLCRLWNNNYITIKVDGLILIPVYVDTALHFFYAIYDGTKISP